MKTKRVFWTIFITALILTIILIFLRTYYVAIALIVGTLLISYPEFWSLVTRKKMPLIDERTRENTGKSIRNGFIFFAVASALLMLFFSVNRTIELNILHALGGLFLAGGIVYLLSYLFYDRAKPRLCERDLRKLRKFLLVAGISSGAFIVSFILHNAISSLFNFEEPVFFFISVFLSPAALAVGLIGSLVIFIKGLATRLP